MVLGGQRTIDVCDYTLVEKMKRLQVKPGVLECTPGPNCWCAELSFRFPLVENGDCMSPKEMLDLYGNDLNEADRRCLTRLLNREVAF